MKMLTAAINTDAYERLHSILGGVLSQILRLTTLRSVASSQHLTVSAAARTDRHRPQLAWKGRTLERAALVAPYRALSRHARLVAATKPRSHLAASVPSQAAQQARSDRDGGHTPTASSAQAGRPCRRARLS